MYCQNDCFTCEADTWGQFTDCLNYWYWDDIDCFDDDWVAGLSCDEMYDLCVEQCDNEYYYEELTCEISLSKCFR